MIYFFTAASHGFTTKGLLNVPVSRPPLVHKPYGWLFEQPSIKFGTAIFTDFDRLNYEHLRRAERISRNLQKAGVRVLNRPAQVRGRFELLRHLHDTGRNPVQVWRAEERPKLSPEDFPVFLKSEGAHKYPIGGLIKTQAQLDREIDRLPDRGVPVSFILVTRFCNTETRPGVWRRYTSYRIGSRVFAGLPLAEDKPFVKYGKYGLATPEDFADATATWRENRYVDWAQSMFDTARIEYGRADFGMVDGKPVLFEINTNPDIPYRHKSRDPAYLLASRATQSLVGYALAALDQPDVEVDLTKINKKSLAI